MTFLDAAAIYYREYWRAADCDKFDYPISAFLFDMCVNSGLRRGKILLQRALEVEDDGIFGPQTFDAAAICDIDEVIRKFRIERCNFYESLARKNPKMVAFLRGWLRRAEEYNPRSLGPWEERAARDLSHDDDDMKQPRAYDEEVSPPKPTLWEELIAKVRRQ